MSDSSYEFVDFIEDTSYLYEYQGGDLLEFVVSTVYESCESDYSNATTIIVGMEDNLISEGIRINPNPFSTSTTLEYDLATPGDVQFTIYNIQGQIVFRMQEKQDIGKQQVQWNAEGLPAGMYYFTVSYNNGRIGSGKLLMTKWFVIDWDYLQ